MKLKKLISFVLIAALAGSIFNIPGNSDNMNGDPDHASAAESSLGSFTRQTINFNREWKFVRDDVTNAELPDYNDSSWYNVGLPHDFSIPYWQEEKHYTGYGWYRKSFDIKNEWAGKRITLDFAGVFHTAEVYVNGELAGTHEGGYTGFEIDITDHVRTGSNVVAIRVNNLWKATLAPRAGEHMFTGGIYRDVNLVITSPVHVAWYGTFVQTPEVSEDRANVRMLTEVSNNSGQTQTVNVINTIYDSDKHVVGTIDQAAVVIAAGASHEFDDTSSYINNPKLWSPENPNLYSVHTEVQVGGVTVDNYDTTFGFRWYEFDPDEGFFLNGEHYWIDGINAHQDHAGWANAVTTDALDRDVAMIKEAGFNFIRGSHYPHSPAYGDSCDKYGILFWSEAPFWCTSAWGEGSHTGTSDDYKVDGYPTTGDKATEEAFEQSCVDALSEMIRINRNHPSIIVWSMGNEPFFGDNPEKKKALISKMAGVAKELDPTRCTAIGGTQRGSFDHLPNVDIAGYNGDGADMPEYQDPGVGNLVSEYSSHTANRPDKFDCFYGSVQTDDDGEPIRFPWRSGIALWCAFHHGSILSRSYGDMGCVDYYRLPLNIWYYYRESRTGVEPEFSQDGTPTKLALSASSTTIKNDGTSDTHITVTVTDDDGNWLNDEPEVTLEIADGPGLFPTGKSITFKPGDNMRDGKAAIEFRSYYAGTTTIRAYSDSDPDLEPATITITTTGEGSVDEPSIETMYGAFMSNGGYVPNSIEEPTAYRYHKFTGCPMHSSSGQATLPNIADCNNATSWTAEAPGGGQWVYMEIEHGGISLYKARLEFVSKVYPYKIQYKAHNISDDEWITLKEYDSNTIASRPYEEDLGGTYMRYIRIEFPDVPAGEYANLAELKLYGLRADMNGYTSGIRHLDDIDATVNDGKYEYVYDLDKDAPGYARFEGSIRIPSNQTTPNNNTSTVSLSSPVTYSAYCDDELIYEKTISDISEVCNIDISVNKVKQLKITASSKDKIKLSLNNMRLMGAYREITRSALGTDMPSSGSENIRTQVCTDTNILAAGKPLNLETRITNKNDNRIPLTFALLLYRVDGTLMKTSLAETSVPGKGQSIMNMSMYIPDTIGTLDLVRLIAWNSDTLVPVTDAMPICENGSIKTANSMVVDAGKAELLASFENALNIIYNANADIYTPESKSGYTQALIDADRALNDGSASGYSSYVHALNNAVNKLALVPENAAAGNTDNTGTGNNISGIGNSAHNNTGANNNSVTTKKTKKSSGKSGKGKTSGNAKKITKGKIYKSGKFRYKILSITKKKICVSLYRPASKKIKKAVIPVSVKINGKKCTVTRIAPKAFAGCSKLTKIVIEKNIKKIGKDAFKNTKNLKKIINRSKVKIKM